MKMDRCRMCNTIIHWYEELHALNLGAYCNDCFPKAILELERPKTETEE